MRRRPYLVQIAAAVAASVAGFALPGLKAADATSCDLGSYKGASGLTAANSGDGLTVTWDGDRDQQLRLRLGIDSGTPTIRELALRRRNGQWGTLATNVTPEFRVVSGLRRIARTSNCNHCASSKSS